MNVPLIQSVDLQQINAALIALKNAIEALEAKINSLPTSNS
jgi:prefoldin subunit 5